jgi:hypothetical protein
MLAVVLVFGVTFGITRIASGSEVCPEEGKVESQSDGDLDGIILPEGTLVCIKGGQTLVEVEADGESTLAELLGTGQNVSHYTILDYSTTTTTLVEETTTTQGDEEPTTTLSQTTTTLVDETTTTTVVEETTTTQSDDGTTTTVAETTTTGGDTTTTVADSTTTTAATTTTTDPATPPELPFTGIPSILWVAAGSTLISTGVFLVRRFRSS